MLFINVRIVTSLLRRLNKLAILTEQSVAVTAFRDYSWEMRSMGLSRIAVNLDESFHGLLSTSRKIP
jgi:hypothetical protein